MYRQPYKDSFRYACGLYQQSHGAACKHNTIDGLLATRFLLACIRQRILTTVFRARLRKAIEEIAVAEQAQSQPTHDAATVLEASLVEVRRKRELAKGNMALATTPDQFQAVSKIFEQLR